MITKIKGIGALIVTHGGTLSEEYGELFLDAIQEAAIPVPTKIVWLVKGKNALPTLSQRVKSLINGDLNRVIASFESEGVDKIVVVPFYLFSYGQEQDRIRYTLGLKPIPKNGTGLPGFDESEVLKHKAKIIMAPAVDNHRLAIEILLERARALSQRPEDDAVIIIAKRPGSENLDPITKNMNDLTAKLKKQGGFKEVRFGFIMEIKRTYIPDSVGDEAARKTKEMITLLKSRVKGNVIALPLFLSDGVMNRTEIPKIIEGLGCLYDPRAFLPHKNVSRWFRESVIQGMKGFTA